MPASYGTGGSRRWRRPGSLAPSEAAPRCARIGAEALALRGASRATLDRDLLTTDARAAK
jgi:hypothetical protein